MNTDIRLSVDFFAHHKTKRVMRMLGGDCVVCLVKMFCYAGKFRPDGVFKGMDAEDIADSVDWRGDADEFVAALCDVGFLEQCEDGIYSIHDWEDHNPWAAGATARSEAAAKAGKASAEKRAQKINGSSTDFNGASTDVERTLNGSSTDFNGALTPSPSPSPSPKEEKHYAGQGGPTPCAAVVENENEQQPKPDPVPYAEIIGKLNATCGCQFKPDTQATRRHIKARWNEGWRFDDFAAVIDGRFAEWGTDPKMCQFVRPETLFGPKFESYLQLARNGRASPSPAESTAPSEAAQAEMVRKARAARAAREQRELEKNSGEVGNAAAQ